MVEPAAERLAHRSHATDGVFAGRKLRLSLGSLLDRYILSELLVPFLVGVSAFVVIFLGQTLYQVVNLILNRGVPAAAVAKMLLYRVPAICVLGMPVATLLAISLTVNRLERESELTSMRGGGIAILRITLPLFLFGAFTSLLSFALNEGICPWANHQSENIVRQIMTARSIPLIEENRYFRVSEDYYFYVHRVDPARKILYDVMIYQRAPGGDSYPTVIIAKRAFKRGSVWYLQHCIVHQYDDNGLLKLEAPPVDEMRCPTKEPIDQYISQQFGATEMHAAELKKQIQLFDHGGIDVHAMQVDYYMKFSVPLACFVLSLIAFPLSRRWARAGSFVGILITILLVFVYNGFMSWSRALGLGGKIPPLAAAWSQNVFFALIGLYFLWRER